MNKNDLKRLKESHLQLTIALGGLIGALENKKKISKREINRANEIWEIAEDLEDCDYSLEKGNKC